MYDLNNAQDVIRQMRDANLVDYQIEDILRQALEDILRQALEEFKTVSIEELKTADDAREHAQEWQAWTANNKLTLGELIDWENYFEYIAKKFDLTEEFKENGVL